MTRVAVVGHIEWVEFVPVERFPRPGDVVHAAGSFLRAGGGGGVVAGVFAELGAEVDFFVALGRDAAGEAAAAQFAEHGIRAHIAWREQPTRRAVTLLDGGGERTIVTIGERLQPRGADQLPWELLREAGGVYFTAGDAGALEHSRQARVVVASPRGREALEGEGVTIDAVVYSANDRDERDWATRVAHRTRLLVETQSERGGRWWGESQGRWVATALPGERRDTYGCGDAFAAGFTFGLAEGATIGDAAAIGAECGAKWLTRAGAP